MAIDFLGTDELLDCGSGATLDNLFASGGTIALWVYWDTLPDNANENGTVIRKSDASDYGWGFYVIQNDGHPVRYMLNHTWNSGANYYQYKSSDNLPVTGVWQHIVCTYDGDQTVHIYKGGVDDTLTTNPTTTGARDADASGSLKMCSTGAYTYYPDCKLEDVRVYKRILSADEILILANGYRGPLGGEAGWWPMLGALGIANWEGATLGTANTIRDESGNGNTATPSGSPLGFASEAPRMPSWIPRAFYNAGVKYTQAVAGAQTNTGRAVKKAKRKFAGASTITGVVIKKAKKILAGALAVAGSVVVRITDWHFSLAGALTSSGAVAKKMSLVRTGLSGALAAAGAVATRLAENTLMLLQGFLGASGSLGTVAALHRSLAGALAISGTVAKKAKTALAGGLSFVGETVKRVKRALAGALGLAGAAYNDSLRKRLSGSLALAGAVRRKTKKGLAGILSFIGRIPRARKDLLPNLRALVHVSRLHSGAGEDLTETLHAPAHTSIVHATEHDSTLHGPKDDDTIHGSGPGSYQE